MSYILDALRKADAERERDPARGIHAQPLAGLPVPEQRPSSARGAWVAAGLVLAAWAGYVFWSHESAAPEVRVAPLPQLAEPASLPAAAPAPVVPPPPAQAVLPPPPPRVVAVAAPAAATAKPAASAPAPAAATSPAPTPVKAAVIKATAAAPLQAAAPVAAAMDQPAASRVFALAELPADVQRELPKFAISGGVHSENVAQRMLIVGGQVLNEGSEIAPGVVLEQIRAKTAVLRYRSYRFSVGY